ncbi:MAG: hypothetical protein V3V00_06490 [Saprospiraceae bacterium]
MRKKIPLETPVLFLVFNRPHTTSKVFKQIQKVQPKKLFIAADGPREDYPDDIIKCVEARSVLNKIDWECEVKTLFRDENLGCGRAVSEGITWFFENVEEGIILEDDCVPDLSFFRFCEKLLDRYRGNKDIMHIGANNYQYGRKIENVSYYYSRYAHVWGWATWRRAWRNFDFNILKKDSNKSSETLLARSLVNDIILRQVDTWDVQWMYSIQRNKGLAITPKISLVKNIGFNSGTHFNNEVPLFYKNVKFGSINDIIYHKGPIVADKVADLFTKKVLYPQSFYEKMVSRIILHLA